MGNTRFRIGQKQYAPGNHIDSDRDARMAEHKGRDPALAYGQIDQVAADYDRYDGADTNADNEHINADSDENSSQSHCDSAWFHSYSLYMMTLFNG